MTEQVHAAPTAGSHAGAEAIAPHAGKLGDRILSALRDAGDRGLTNGELTTLLKGRDVTVWPRVSSLKARGKVKDSGRTRPSPHTGTAMSVWVLTTPEEEREILAERKRQAEAIEEAVTPEALEAAEEIRREWALGDLFRSRDHLARTVQNAINARLTRQARTRLKQERQEAVARRA